MDLRTHYPYSLLKYGLIQSYPSLKKNVRTDVAIIGAGITGALIAYHLQKKGIECLVFDKRHVATGSTAASTSLIQYEIDVPLHKLVDMVGYKNAARSYQVSREAIQGLKQVCIETGNAEIFESKCSLQFASYQKDVKALEKEYRIRKEHGFKVDLLSSKDVKKDFHFSAPAGLYVHEAAQLDAYLLTHKILASLQPSSVFDHTEIVSIKHEKNGVVLSTQDGFIIKAKHLVMAAGYESAKYINKKIEELHCTYAIVTEPMEKENLWKNNCLIWETADPYLYIRTRMDNRILIGGKDTKYFSVEKQLQLLPQKAKALQKNFENYFRTCQ